MSRYIDADAAIQWVEENECYTDKFKRIMEGVIDEQPTVDAVPVVHGEWVKEPMTFEKFYNDPYVSANCSICGARSRERGNYCPNCGARMRTVTDCHTLEEGERR